MTDSTADDVPGSKPGTSHILQSLKGSEIEPLPSLPIKNGNGHAHAQNGADGGDRSGLFARMRGLFRPRNGGSLRDTLEGLIEEGEDQAATIAEHERVMISNILALHDLTAEDVMVPRADIVAVDVETPVEELIKLVAERGHSRFPVYRETLDDLVGMVHIKDVIAKLAAEEDAALADLIRKPLIVAPSMRVLDLLLEMRQSRRQLGLVIDEFGGVDGLVTIEDLVEGIVGEIEDEFDTDNTATMVTKPDGSVLADARVSIEDLETRCGKLLSDEERQDIDTLGGLAFSLAGRVPTRGELLRHASGLELEIVEADPRRIRTLRLRQLPTPPSDS